MNTFVPKYMREKSGFTTEAAKIRAAEAAKQEKAALKAAEEAAKKAAKLESRVLNLRQTLHHRHRYHQPRESLREEKSSSSISCKLQQSP